METLSTNASRTTLLVHHQEQEQLVNLVEGSISDLQTEGTPEEFITIPKEMLLISLVSQEQALYNPKHINYRNTKNKEEKWHEIAENVGWTETQCKAKWKALRDQYCRELKRSKTNSKASVKWKYFKELDFLRPFALSRHYRPKALSTNKNGNNTSASNNITNSDNNTVNSNNNTLNSSGGSNNSHSLTDNTFPNIKIETATTSQFTNSQYTNNNSDNNIMGNTKSSLTLGSIKSEPMLPMNTSVATAAARLLSTYTDEQLTSVMQQQDGNWNYLTATTTSIPVSAIPDLQEPRLPKGVDEVLYNALVHCVDSTTASQLQQQTHQSQQTEEEDEDDPIHTFLNIESYFEKELIAMIQQEDILYNNYHLNYRNVKMKMMVWDEIARKLKKTVTQCRLKWKALRDQYIREHKRLRNRENAEMLPRWKHYDVLHFLQKFIKHKTSDDDKQTAQQTPKIEMETDLDEDFISSAQQQQQSTPLRVGTAENHSIVLDANVQLLPSLSGPHTVQQLQALQQQQQQNGSCVGNENGVSGNAGAVAALSATESVGSGGEAVSAYGDMDYDNYMMGGDESPVADADDMDVGEEDDGLDEEPDDEVTAVSAVVVHSEQDVVTPMLHVTKIDQDQLLQHQSNSKSSNLNNQEESIQSFTLSKVDLDVAVQQQQQHMITVTSAIADAAAKLVEESLHQQHPPNSSLSQGQQPKQQQTHQHQQQLQYGNANNSNNTRSAVQPSNGLVASANSSNANSSPIYNNNNNTSNNNVTESPPFVASYINNNNNNTNNNSSNHHTDDDEVGAFFKAVAMKIRNAQIPPVALTDLQIEILRVINGSLRNN